MAGGTDLLVKMKYRLELPRVVVGLRALPELSAVSEDREGNIRIGACAKLSDLVSNSLLSQKAPAFLKAVNAVASRHIRNMACIGGNVCLDNRCWYYNQSEQWRSARDICYKAGGSQCHAIKGSDRCHAINCSDTAPMLVALKANLVIRKKGAERVVPADMFYQDDGACPNVLQPEEVLTEIILPGGDPSRWSSFIRISHRRGIDFALGSIAAVIRGINDKPASVRLVLGSVRSAPLVLEKAAHVEEESGVGDATIEEAADAAVKELGVPSNVFSSAGYKRDLARTLVKRVLHEYNA